MAIIKKRIKQEMTSDVEGVDKREPLSTIGLVNGFSYYRKQYGVSSKN